MNLRALYSIANKATDLRGLYSIANKATDLRALYSIANKAMDLRALYSIANKATNLRALYSIFIEKRLLRWDSNPRPPVFKEVALPTEPPRQPSWLGSNHTS